LELIHSSRPAHSLAGLLLAIANDSQLDVPTISAQTH
jgi:hypothetical protein